MGPWTIWLWRLLRSRRFRAWLLATAGPRALALFVVFLERVRHRRIAIGEADQIDGMFSAAIVDGERHLVVWKDGEPVSAYPPVRGDLRAKLRTHARRDLVRPDELLARRARRAAGELGRRAGAGVRGVGGRAGAGAHVVGGAARRAAGASGRALGGAGRRAGEGARSARRLLPGGRGDGA